MAGSSSSTVKALSAGAVKWVVEDLARTFKQDNGTSVEITFGTIGGIRKRLDAGERGDFMMGTTPAVTELERGGLVAAGSRRELGRTLTGICVRAGAAVPDISTPAAFRNMLLSVRSFAYTDPRMGGTSGIFLTGLMERLGVLDAVRAKAVLCINGDDVVEKVAQGAAEAGSTFISEMVLAGGVTVAGPLPAGIGNATSYSAGLLDGGANPDGAGRFIAYITAPERREAWIRGGFERA